MKNFNIGATKLFMALIVLSILIACKKQPVNTNEKEELVFASGSNVAWKGFLETGYFNSGTIGVTPKNIFLQGDKIIGGEINIPVSSIVITNELPDDKKDELLDHLKSDAFFNLLVHPFVTYRINTAEKNAVVDQLGNNYTIKGSMKLLGKELPLDIPAKIIIKNTEIKVTSIFKFDRTKWGMNFASDEGLPAKDKIKNEIQVEMDLMATRF